MSHFVTFLIFSCYDVDRGVKEDLGVVVPWFDHLCGGESVRSGGSGGSGGRGGG
jgi:hypothetical protein